MTKERMKQIEESVKKIDKEHGPVVDTKVTELAWIFTHKDGFKEIVWQEDMEVLEVE